MFSKLNNISIGFIRTTREMQLKFSQLIKYGSWGIGCTLL